MKTADIENVLRQAPKPQPAASLKERLRAAAAFPPHASLVAERNGFRQRSGEWLKRWWPALAPAAVSLACAALFTAQQGEIRRLQTMAPQQPQAAPAASAPTDAEPNANNNVSAAAQLGTSDEANEMDRLRAEAARLTGEISTLERMKAENQGLRQQIAAKATSVFTPEEIANLETAKEKALNIQCVNNLKQLGLASRIWAVDHAEVTPARVLDMTNEISTPKILVCPAEGGRQVASDWSSYTAGNCSYEYLAASATTAEPNRVLFRCPVHGNIALVDGSVHAAIAKNHPDWLLQKDGKLYMRAAGSISVEAPHQ